MATVRVLTDEELSPEAAVTKIAEIYEGIA